jgi:hypothetical protein
MISAPPTHIITDTIRKQLTDLLREGHAHSRFEDVVENIPADLRGTKVPGLPYTIWQIVEHLRITQWDILMFSQFATHRSPQWPEGYWVENMEVVDEETWQKSLNQIWDDKELFIALINNPDIDIYMPFTHGTGQSYIREALVLADHNSYHTGQIVVLRRLLGAW